MNFLFRFLIALGLLGLTACDNLSELQNYASKELGCPVKIRTNSKDYCALEQLKVFQAEYWKLSPSEKSQIKQALQKFRAVVIAPSRTVHSELNCTTHLDVSPYGSLVLTVEQKENAPNSVQCGSMISMLGLINF